MSGSNGVSGNNYFKLSDFWSKPSLQGAKTEETVSGTPIQLTLTDSDSFKREDLSDISPYAALGVKFSLKTPAGSPESYMKAAPEFGRWHGNFGPLNKQELAALGNLSSLCSRIAETKADVASHLQDSPFDCFSVG